MEMLNSFQIMVKCDSIANTKIDTALDFIERNWPDLILHR